MTSQKHDMEEANHLNTIVASQDYLMVGATNVFNLPTITMIWFCKVPNLYCIEKPFPIKAIKITQIVTILEKGGPGGPFEWL